MGTKRIMKLLLIHTDEKHEPPHLPLSHSLTQPTTHTHTPPTRSHTRAKHTNGEGQKERDFSPVCICDWSLASLLSKWRHCRRELAEEEALRRETRGSEGSASITGVVASSSEHRLSAPRELIGDRVSAKMICVTGWGRLAVRSKYCA